MEHGSREIKGAEAIESVLGGQSAEKVSPTLILSCYSHSGTRGYHSVLSSFGKVFHVERRWKLIRELGSGAYGVVMSVYIAGILLPSQQSIIPALQQMRYPERLLPLNLLPASLIKFSLQSELFERLPSSDILPVTRTLLG